MIETSKVLELVAQRWQIGRSVHLADFEAIGESMEPMIRIAVDRTVLGFKAWCLAEVHEAKIATVKHHSSWWDHFKADCFPAWLLKKYPAIMVDETVFEPITVRVCPHIHRPIDKNNLTVHLGYLNPKVSMGDFTAGQ